MIKIESSILIYRPLNEVFDFITSSARDFEWQAGTLASGNVPDGASGVGTSFRSVGHLMGRRLEGTFEITEHEAHRRYGFKSLSGPLHLHTMYKLEFSDGGTWVDISTQATAANMIQAEEHTIQKYMQKQLTEDLTKLKAVLESR
ncbi:MAG: SRPBCC family protein [Chloroflexota bacterium]